MFDGLILQICNNGCKDIEKLKTFSADTSNMCIDNKLYFTSQNQFD